jgi:protein-tyrosine-phosphatase
MDKKKSIINVNKLTSIIKPMTRLQLNKFVSNLNKQLKITNASKMKRTELESELLMNADIIIDMIENDKELKLFDTTTKPKQFKITQEEQNQMSKEIMEISQKAIEEKDMGAKSKLTKEALKKSQKLAKSTISDMPTKQKIKVDDKETEDMLHKKFSELSKKILKEKDIAIKQKMMKESSEIMNKLQKMA